MDVRRQFFARFILDTDYTYSGYSNKMFAQYTDMFAANVILTIHLVR